MLYENKMLFQHSEKRNYCNNSHNMSGIDEAVALAAKAHAGVMDLVGKTIH